MNEYDPLTEIGQYNQQAEKLERLLRAKPTLVHWDVERATSETWQGRHWIDRFFDIRACCDLHGQTLHCRFRMAPAELTHGPLEQMAQYVMQRMAGKFIDAILNPGKLEGNKPLDAHTVLAQARDKARALWHKGDRPALILVGDNQKKALEQGEIRLDSRIEPSRFELVASNPEFAVCPMPEITTLQCRIVHVNVPDYLDVIPESEVRPE